MSLSTTLKNLYRYSVGGTAPTGAASSTGDIGQMVKYIVANNAIGPLGFDIFGKVFPYTNGSATDLVINGSDQTVAPTNGVLRYRSITFTTAHTLRITSSPCILMVDTLTWNAAGVVACEASGAPALGADPAESFPRGGRAFSTADAIGGYGGGFLIVLATTVNGSTTGTIRANGTAANSNATAAGAQVGRGGEGALSARMSYANNGPTTLFTLAEAWTGTQSTGAASPTVSPGTGAAPTVAALALAPGGEANAGAGNGGAGGGSGLGAAAAHAGGGSGFGAGGGAGAAVAVTAALVVPSLPQVLALHQMGCRGGGGGGAVIHPTGSINAAGGGGGGCVVLVVDVETQVSTLTAAGGARSGNATVASVGGAGVTLRQVI